MFFAKYENHMSLLQKDFCFTASFLARAISDRFCKEIRLGGNFERRFFHFSAHYSLRGGDFAL